MNIRTVSTHTWTRMMTLVTVMLGAALTTGCVYQGGDVNPLERKFTWYSYLNGDDLRSHCAMGQPSTLRLVYNAIHTEQIRTYDITIPNDGSDALLQALVLGPPDLTKLGFDDFLAPWRGDKATTHLRKQDVVQLWSTLENSKAFDPAPVGLFLTSEKFFWLTAICRDGTFSYNAYVWPSDRFDAVQFSALLFAWDMTEIPVNTARRATSLDIYGEANPRRKTGSYYQLSIDENGLK